MTVILCNADGSKVENAIAELASRREPNTGKTFLHIVAETGNYWATKQLLKCADVATVTAVDNEKNTLLHVAARKGLGRLAKEIIPYFAYCDTTGAINCGETPLHIAGYLGDEELAEILLDSGKFSLRSKNSKGETSLQAIFIGKEGKRTQVFRKGLSLCSLDDDILQASPNIELHLYNAVDNWDVETVLRCRDALVQNKMWTPEIGTECLLNVLFFAYPNAITTFLNLNCANAFGQPVLPSEDPLIPIFSHKDSRSHIEKGRLLSCLPDIDVCRKLATKPRIFDPVVQIVRIVLEAGADIFRRVEKMRFRYPLKDHPRFEQIVRLWALDNAVTLPCADRLIPMMFKHYVSSTGVDEALSEFVTIILGELCYVLHVARDRDANYDVIQNVYRAKLLEFLLQETKNHKKVYVTSKHIAGVITHGDFDAFQTFLRTDWDFNPAHKCSKAKFIWESIQTHRHKYREDEGIRKNCEEALKLLYSYQREGWFQDADDLSKEGENEKDRRAMELSLFDITETMADMDKYGSIGW